MVSAIAYRVQSVFEVQIKEILGVDELVAFLMNFDSDCVEEYDELAVILDRRKHHSKPEK